MGVPDVSTLAVVVKSDGISKTSSELSGLGTSAKNAETKVVSLTASVEKLMGVQKTATGSALAYAQALSSAQQHLGGNQASTLGLETATAMLAKSMAALSASLQNVKEKSVQSRVAMQEHTAHMKDAHAVARGLAGGLGALWLTYGNIAPMLAGVAIARGFMEAAKSGADFAYQLKFVQGLGEETAVTMDRVSASILNMSKGSMFSPVEMAQGMRVLSQAGLDAASALKVLPQAMDLAVVGEMSMEKASITLVGVMNAFKLSIADIPHVGDVFAKAAAVSQTSVEAMTESMKTASVVGSQYNVSMEDAATALTLLAKVNITGTAAGTSFKNMLKELYSPGKQAADLMKNMGLSTADAAGELRPFANIIYDLKGKLQEFDSISQTQILQRLFGERGAKEAVAMLSKTREEWDALQSSIANSDGFMRKVSSTLEDTVKGKWIQAVNTFKAQLIQTFEVMAPHLAEMADNLQRLFADESFVEGLKKVASGIASIATTLVKLAPAIITVAEAWLVYKSAMIGAAVWTAATVAVTEFSAAMLAMSGAMGPTTTGMVGVRGIIASLPVLLGAIPTPMTIIAGLLAAGATAWMLWGDSASRAGDKAFDSASRAEAALTKAKNRQKYGVGDVGEARQELDKAENLLVLRVQGRATGTALSDARASVDKWTAVVDSLEQEAHKASGAATTLSAALAGSSGGRKASELSGPNKAAISDSYAAAIEEIKGKMQAVNDWSKSNIAELVSLNKQGLVGDIELINKRLESEKAAHQVGLALIQEKIDKERPENRTATEKKFYNELNALRRADVESEAVASREIAEYFAKMEERKKQEAIAGYKATGDYVAAFQAEQGAKWGGWISSLERDIQLELDPEKLGKLKAELKNIQDMLTKGTASAEFKEANYHAQALIRTIEAGVEAIEAKYSDGSFISKLFNAEELSAFYQQHIPEAFKALEEARIKSEESKADADVKAYQTQMKAFQKLVKGQRDVYKEFIADIDRIGSEGFRALFDKTDGSWKSYVKKMKDSFKTYLIDEIYKMFARPFVMNILANITGAAGMTGLSGALSAAGSGGGLGNLLSTGKSLYDLTGLGATTAAATGTTLATTAIGSGLTGGAGTVGLAQGVAPVVGEMAAGGGAAAAGAGGLISGISTAMPYIGAAIAAVSIISSLFGDNGPVERYGKYDREFGSAKSLTDNPDGGELYPWKNNFRFSDDMRATQDSFNASLIASEQNAIKNLNLTTDQIALVNAELEKSATTVYNFGMEKTDWLQSSASSMIAATRIQAVAKALGKSLEEVAAAMDPVFGELLKMGKQVGFTIEQLVKMAPTSAKMSALTSDLSLYFNTFYTQAERQAPLNEALKKSFDSLDLSIPTSMAGFRNLVDGLDKTTESGRNTYTALLKLIPAFVQFTDAAANAATEALNAVKAAGQVALEGVSKAFSVLQKSVAAEREKATKAHEAALTILNEKISTVNDSISRMTSLSRLLRNTIAGMSISSQYGLARAEAQAQIATALAIAKASGVLPTEESLQDALSIVGQPSEQLFASFTEYQRDFQLTANSITDLANLTDGQLSAAEQSLAILEDQLEVENNSYTAIIANLDSILAKAQAEVDAINGVTVAVLSIADALNNLASMLNIAKANPTVKGGTATTAIEAAYQSALGRPSDTAGLAYWQQQVASGNSTVAEVVSNITNSREAQIQDAYESILGRSADTGGMDYWYNSGLSVDQIASAIANSAEATMPKFAAGGEHRGGWRMVGENGPEIEYTGPSTIFNNAQSSKMLDQSEVSDEIRQLREDLRAANAAIAQSSSRTAKLLERWDGDGMPTDRVIA